MNKKNILIIIPILVIIILIVILLFNSNNIEEKLEKKLFPTIKERIDKKESFMILVTNTNPNETLSTYCMHCKRSSNFINYNKKLYNLDIITYDKYKYSDEDYNNVEDYLKLEKNFIIPPAIIYVENGNWSSIENEIRSENDFKEYLVRYNYIKEEELDKEKQINTQEEFEKIYSKEENSIIVLYSFENDITKIRKKLHEISLTKSFTYYMICTNIASDINVNKIFRNKYGDKFKTPSIAIVGNNQIIDYTSSTEEEDIERFILKNINK